jgi:Prokaryotic RING finger family 4
MDPIRTLLLARTHTVILDADLVASASTRPARYGAVDRFEAELVELGFVMSLDLAMTIRRLPNQAIEALRGWMVSTLARLVGSRRPAVPLFRGLPEAAPSETSALYVRRVLSWLVTRPEQPCPWCGQHQVVGALDPCGHLVCRGCWTNGAFSGCPVCHRRISPKTPFLEVPPRRDQSERVQHHAGDLRVLHLAQDLNRVARERFERVIGRAARLSKEDRTELETVIDALGPRAAAWLPASIPVEETLAVAVARLWMVSPDRAAMVRATQRYLRTATDVLRVAAVLMEADPSLAEPLRLRSIGRGLRRAVLEALDRLPADELVDDMLRRPGLWKRAGERLHPFELADKLPTAALAFAALRGTDLAAASFGAALRARAAELPNVRISDDRVRVVPWGGPVEAALRDGDARAAAGRLAARPALLLRRADQIARVASVRQPAALADVLAAIRDAIPRAEPAALLALASHVARRGAPWPRRIFFPGSNLLRAWSAPDDRPPLPPGVIASLVDAARAELLDRAAARPRFARAVLDRGLADLRAPFGEPTVPRAKLAWPRGSALPLPDAPSLRLFLHWEDPPGARVDLDLSVAVFDADWRHLGTCDHTHRVVAAADGTPAATHSGDLTAAPAPLGASEAVDLHLGPLAAAGARHLVAVVFGYKAASFDRLEHSFAGITPAPPTVPFDPRAVWPRLDLHGQAVVTIPLTIDLEARRVRWLDVHIRGRGALRRIGGHRATLAHLGRDFDHLLDAAARPSLWEVACIHAAARANTIYVRGPAGISVYRRRDDEPTTCRLARLLAGDHDATVAAIPAANAPTWVALLRDDLPFPRGSAGYILDARPSTGELLARQGASALISELAPK